MKSQAKPLFAAALVAVAVVGCGDSSTAPDEGLKLGEAEALYDALREMALFAFPETGGLFPATSTLTRTCSRGGEVTVSAEFELVTDDSSVQLNFDIDPDACGVASQGWEFKLDGNPDVKIVLTVRSSADFTESLIDGSVTGGVDWELDDRSGTCMIDLMLSGGVVQNFSEPQAFGTAAGTMCGLEVEFDA
ncbi:MAG: hypothetical protein OXH51_00550 [Gemmatimonadetes bacterium]|nr:hypothetical protein [Gemmatimonadota bacterium]MCY3610013.1 hypothetical protein [Gemmatimonadota bacterium]MYA43209.1 hypothetical protein [Gemmatimonadota bacterium]MYE92340.1 hypothetical protein [Gemmatimonadota bacterium]MYJ11084.1 hypothetical protein [Gemmatimonadota bacterium]